MTASTRSQTHGSVFFDAASFATYEHLLHRYLTRRLRLPQDVEDLTHDVYVRLLQYQYQSVPISFPRAYLYGVASHVLADYWTRGLLPVWLTPG